MSLALTNRKAALLAPWNRNPLWSAARAVPSLDLRFADSKSLTDAASGQSLVTFTRASSGTYTDSQGVLRTATTNLLLQSNSFTTGWTTTDSTATANQISAPDGTGNGWKLVTGIGNTNHNIFQSIGWTAAAWTVSLFARYLDHRWLGVRIGAAGSQFFGSWDLLNGVVGSATAGATIGIQNVGGGWYRLTLTATLTTAASANFIIGLNNADATSLTTYTGTGTGVYLFGAQVEQSSTAGEYIPTTSTINSAPRFDHNPTTGESLGLLVEEQRTNLVLRSEELNETSWTKINCSISANAIAAPNGTLTADKVIENTAASVAHICANESASVVSATVYTLSVFCKAAERSWVFVLGSGAPFGTNGIYVNLATGATGSSTGSPSSVVVTPFGNGWYRISFVLTAGSSAAAGLQVRPATGDNGGTYTGDGTSGIYIWGAQLEAGAFPTSYIPTTTAAATRSADVASISGSSFSSWFTSSGGTCFAEFRASLTTSSSTLYSFNDTTASNRITGLASSTAFLAGRNTNGAGVTFTPYTANAPTAAASNKAAIAFADLDVAIVGNGGTPGTASTYNVPTVTRLELGQQLAGTYLNGTIRRLTYWPQRLSNSTLQAITQ